jgi:alkylhydroperoxidase/carboxymuconolactone decarboxylase family protein YurZ
MALNGAQHRMNPKDNSMTNDTNSKTPVCDAMRAGGDWNPAWDPFAELDPLWTERFMAMAATPIAKGVLDPKVYEFLAIAVDASCTHMYAPGVRRHIRKALELGATREEILAVLQCVSVLGIHSCSLGVPILVEEFARTQRVKE